MTWHVFVLLESLLRQLRGEGIHYVGGHCEWSRWKSGFGAFRSGVDEGAMGWWWAVGKMVDAIVAAHN